MRGQEDAKLFSHHPACGTRSHTNIDHTTLPCKTELSILYVTRSPKFMAESRLINVVKRAILSDGNKVNGNKITINTVSDPVWI